MKRMKHVVLVVLDGAGAGYQPDADKYGDVGANTLGHVIEQEPSAAMARCWSAPRARTPRPATGSWRA